MRYLLSCTCGETFPVSKSQAGTEVKCPKCGNPLEVPAIRNLAKLPVEQAVATPLSSQAAKQSGGWSLPVGIFAGICFLVLSVTWGMAGVLAFEHLANRDMLSELSKWGVQEELEYGDTMVDAYTVAELYDVWEEYRVMGLGNKEPPKHFVIKNAFEASKRQMYLMFGIGAVAFVLIVLATKFGRRSRSSASKTAA